jgi:cell division protein ZapA (FtsZ GTPase activity inhibitor)
MSEISIKVEVAGSVYPLKVAPEDEKNIKEAVELINNKIGEFERNYPVKDKKDVLGMVMLMLVSQLCKKAGAAEQELSHLKQMFTEVEAMLKQHLQAISDLNEQ